MEQYLERINDSVYAFLRWDESWNSYNNCYLIVQKNEVTLIDSGKNEHFGLLLPSLKDIGISPTNINTFLATHGHRDHVGGVEKFSNAQKYIHADDLYILKPEQISEFNTKLDLINNEIEWLYLGHHTPGSVAYLHKASETLFCGDHICFFGEPLPNGERVVSGAEVSEKLIKFVSDWSKNEQMRIQHNFDLFLKGVTKLKQVEAKYLCTGHGVIIKDNINKFLSNILDSIGK